MNIQLWLDVGARKLTRQKLLQILFVSGSAWILVANSAIAKEVKALSARVIPHLSEIQLPVTSSFWVSTVTNITTSSHFGSGADYWSQNKFHRQRD